MIVIVKNGASREALKELTDRIEGQGLKIHMSQGESTTIMGLIGDVSRVDIDLLRSNSIVEAVRRISEPFKKANRKFHPADTVVEIPARDGAVKLGGGEFCLIAGPCSVESEEQILSIARSVKAAGAHLLRGGAFKPRTSPYAFQGLGTDGLQLLLKAKAETGLPIVTEIMSVDKLEFFSDVDVIQVGARNMQNFELLKELGKCQKPILLKRGLSSTIEEWLMSAEYILASGNPNVILCERGIRTFEHFTRNTLDISAIPVAKELSHLPIIVDPSHSAGYARFVAPLSMAAAAAGADGLIIEVHNDPTAALCDGAQCIKPDAFGELTGRLSGLLSVMGGKR
ncbi:MAG: 3-deoxy-7-phosphoheptulonate synthase [Firmicutes bacterium]|nr:3-deoxy-7-phosphoheptulonate synthase [Bacillota bacterium]